MNQLVETSQHPELVMGITLPSLAGIQVHLEPVHVVVDEKLYHREPQGGHRVRKEAEQYQGSQTMLTSVYDAS